MVDPGSLPVWAQAAAAFSAIVVSVVVGVFRYLKTEAKPDTKAVSPSNSVISASFIESKLLKELIEAIREFQDEQGRDIKKTHRGMQDLRDSLNDLNESVIVNTDTVMNLVRFVNRDTNRSRVVDVRED